MQRYRVVRFDFDARAAHLRQEILDEWEPHVKELAVKNRQTLIDGLVAEYGTLHSDVKIQNFIDIDSSPLSIVAFHNHFFRQARNAFVIGAYYPAITGVCALGERILNHLILTLRDDFKSSGEFKKVARKKSFDNWDTAIEVLLAWKILRPETAQHFYELKEIRNKRIHFDYSTDSKDRESALDAIKKMLEIIQSQFLGFGDLPWFIPNTKGACYIKREYESDPFVERIYLPNCALVGPNYRMEYDVATGHWIIHDDVYEQRDITDEEFVQLLKASGRG